jgi:predicted protein tyrosine phosphatase
MKLCDMSLKSLAKMLRATERFAGPNAQSVEILRRAIAQKRETERRKASRGKRR